MTVRAVSVWLTLSAVGCQWVFPYDPPQPVGECTERTAVWFDEFTAFPFAPEWDRSAIDPFDITDGALHIGGSTNVELATHWYYELTAGHHITLDLAPVLAHNSTFELRARGATTIEAIDRLIEERATSIIFENDVAPTVRVVHEIPPPGAPISSDPIPYREDEHRYIRLANVSGDWVWQASADGVVFVDLASGLTAMSSLVQLRMIAKAGDAANDVSLASICSTLPTAGAATDFAENYRAGDGSGRPNGSWSMTDAECGQLTFEPQVPRVAFNYRPDRTNCRLRLRQQQAFVDGTQIEIRVQSEGPSNEVGIEFPDRRRVRLAQTRIATEMGDVTVYDITADNQATMLATQKYNNNSNAPIVFVRRGDRLEVRFDGASLADLALDPLVDRVGVELGVSAVIGNNGFSAFAPLTIAQP